MKEVRQKQSMVAIISFWKTIGSESRSLGDIVHQAPYLRNRPLKCLFNKDDLNIGGMSPLKSTGLFEQG